MSAVKDTHRGAKESLTIDDVRRLIESARASIHPGTTHFCQLCSVQELDPRGHAGTDDGIEPFSIVRYRGTRVLEGASNGCDFFRELIIRLENTLQERGYGNDRGGALEFWPRKWICELSTWSTLRWATIKWNSVESELPAMSPPDVARWTGGINDGYGYAFVADGDDPASATVRARPSSYECTPSQAAAWAGNMLRRCETDHEACSKPDPSFVPSRLLRLQLESGGQILVTLETDAATGRRGTTSGLEYTALSYCWGGAQELRLDATSVGKLTRGIHASSLPATLRDAVLFTWNLGLCFVWIDCLCIRQDDQEDLDLEIAQIPAIYGNSHITISAARANHSREGFLHQSSLTPRTASAFKLPFACPDGNLGSVILSKTQLSSPIDHRAWTLQEYILSRRVLQFTHFRLHWTCRGTALLCGDEPDSLPGLHYNNLSKLHHMYRGFYASTYNCRDWMNIVKVYTTRDLTYSSDKLKAISGVAEIWGARSGGSYVAGLWRLHLPLGLLWTSAQPHIQTALTTYRAPSWSWASLDGQIDYFDHIHTQVDDGLTIVDYSATPAYKQAPYGSVVSGLLVIGGHLQETLLSASGETPYLSPLSLASGELLNLSFATVFKDFSDNTWDCMVGNSKIYCLQVCAFDEEMDAGPSGLILATQDEENFRRIGVFFFGPPDEEDVRLMGDYATISSFAEALLCIQRRAFQNVTPRIVKIL